jgi:hypothetical protein
MNGGSSQEDLNLKKKCYRNCGSIKTCLEW